MRVHLILNVLAIFVKAELQRRGHSETCSMCGKFCAVRSMNKALNSEYIDIL